jgi:hypothetical protein
MPSKWLLGAGGLCAALVGLGCATSQSGIRPPHVESYELPPNEERFSKTQYPSEVLNQAPSKKDYSAPGAPAMPTSTRPTGMRTNPGL